MTDAAVVDYDGDGKEDLVLVGEWLAPTFFRNTGAKLEKIEMPEMGDLKGWYQSIAVVISIRMENLIWYWVIMV